MNLNQIENLRKRTAELSVGASTVRGAGAPGTASTAREALKRVRLSKFNVRSRKQYIIALEAETKRIQRNLPPGAQHWGVARKVLNIFLRSCVSNRPLAEHYCISHIEPLLELPLDSHVAGGIKACHTPAGLPRWKTIKGLTREVSAQYQSAAREIAKNKDVAPIHLEYCWYRVRPKRCCC